MSRVDHWRGLQSACFDEATRRQLTAWNRRQGRKGPELYKAEAKTWGRCLVVVLSRLYKLELKDKKSHVATYLSKAGLVVLCTDL